MFRHRLLIPDFWAPAVLLLGSARGKRSWLALGLLVICTLAGSGRLLAHPSDWVGVEQVVVTAEVVPRFVTATRALVGQSQPRETGSDEEPVLDQVLPWAERHPAAAEAISKQHGFDSFKQWKSVTHSLGIAYQAVTLGDESAIVRAQNQAAIDRIKADAGIPDDQKRDIIDGLRERLADIKKPHPENVTLVRDKLRMLKAILD